MFTNSKKVNVDFFLSELSVTKIISRKCHVDHSTTGRYDMILGIDPLTSMGLNLNFYENITIGSEGLCKG